MTASNPDDDEQLNKVISAAREDKLVTKDNIAGQLTDYAKASDLSAKADANDVYSKTDAENTFATKTELGSYATRTELDAKANTNLSNLTEEGKNAIKTTMADELAKKADAANVYTMDKVDEKLDLKANKAEVSASLNEKADKTALNQATDRIAANEDNITALQTKTQKINHDVANDTTSVNGMKVGQQQVDMGGKDLTNVGTINGIELGTKESGDFISQNGSIWGNMKNVDAQVGKNLVAIGENKEAIAALDTKVGTVGTGEYLDPTKSVGENLGRLDAGLKKEVDDRTAADDALSGRITDNAKEIARVNQELVNTNNHFNTELGNTNAALQAEGQARANADAALANDITATNKRTAGIGRTDTGVEADNQTVIEGKVHFDQNGNVSGVKDLKTDTIHATGEINTTGKVSAGDVSTGTLETTGNAKIGGDLTVDGKLNVGEIYLENNKLEAATGKIMIVLPLSRRMGFRIWLK